MALPKTLELTGGCTGDVEHRMLLPVGSDGAGDEGVAGGAASPDVRVSGQAAQAIYSPRSAETVQADQTIMMMALRSVRTRARARFGCRGAARTQRSPSAPPPCRSCGTAQACRNRALPSLGSCRAPAGRSPHRPRAAGGSSESETDCGGVRSRSTPGITGYNAGARRTQWTVLNFVAAAASIWRLIADTGSQCRAVSMSSPRCASCGESAIDQGA